LLGLFRVALRLFGGHSMKNLLVTLFLASLLDVSAALAAPSDTQAGSVQAPNYWTKFEGLGCCIVRDSLHTDPQALQPGQGGAGETAAWIPESDALRMELTAPAPLQPNTPSMGIFKTGQNYGPGTNFSVSATFRSPQGRMDGPAWTVTVVARTGDAADLSKLGRLQLSLRVKTGVHLRIQEGPDAPSTGAISGATQYDFVPTDTAYQEIYVQHKPFTLRLDVDRKAGNGVATLTTASKEFQIPFQMGLFKKDEGDALTTVGAAMANNIPGEKVSVEVTDMMVAKH
jgi:hypothetical protein